MDEFVDYDYDYNYNYSLKQQEYITNKYIIFTGYKLLVTGRHIMFEVNGERKRIYMYIFVYMKTTNEIINNDHTEQQCTSNSNINSNSNTSC